MKSLGPKFGPRLKEVQTALTTADAAAIAKRVQASEPFELACPGGAVTLDPADVVIQWQAPDGWAGVADRGTQVLLDTRVTPELVSEGTAREIVRHVQATRKEADLDIADRIALYLGTESAELGQVIATHREAIGSATLTADWSDRPLTSKRHGTQVKVDGQLLLIELRPI
jgi:isoleucyl-tRNA synthetase